MAKTGGWKALAVSVVLLLCAVAAVHAQIVSGNVAGTVMDKSGAVVATAKVTAVNVATGFSKTVNVNDKGEYLFSNLPTGIYNVTAEAAGFAKTEIGKFPVELNQTNTLDITLEVRGQSVTVEVSGAPPPIDTTTQQLGTTFDTISTTDLPVSTVGAGVLNLALYNAGVTSSGGVGVGTGPSVAGQRPRNNDFTIEGVDNNDKGVTGPLVTVPNDAVAEFATLQNIFSPEFGHSTGGQFNTIVKSGTNQFHGTAYDYTQNRGMNAIDPSITVTQGVGAKNPRFDDNRMGGNIGGPIFKNKLFFFADGEYEPVGAAAVPTGGVCAPTAAGYATLAALPPGPSPDGTTMLSVNMNNLSILQKFVAPAPSDGGCQNSATPTTNIICTGGSIPDAKGGCPEGTPVNVDTGLLPLLGPNFTNNRRVVAAMDYNFSDKDQFRGRYIYNLADGIDFAAEFPVFFQTVPARFHLIALNEYHTFRPNLTNEFRFGFNRFATADPAGNFSFPGLDSFPNLEFFDQGIQLGPDPNAPQTTVQNLYQFSDGLSWVKGAHNLKFGVEFRWFIAPETFTQRSRGDYDYSSLGTYLYDVNPDFLAERSGGNPVYYGNQKSTYWYVNDTWRIRPTISINLGVRYEYTTIPLGEQLQALNGIASDPTISTPRGPLIFNAPRAPKDQWEPRIGIAWSPGSSGNTSIRAGFSLGYDTLFDNLGLLTLPPELSVTVDKDQTTAGIINGFLAGGAIPPGNAGAKVFPNAAAARAVTSAFLPLNLKNPAAADWTLGVEHRFAKSYTVEVRYVGTHGYYLPVQTRINRQPEIGPAAGDFYPTFLTDPGQAAVNAMPVPTLTSSFVPAYAADGFFSNITSYQPIGNSMYHGLAAQITRRFDHGLQFVGAYTYSHAIDDSTAEVFSTVLTPRRPQDFQDVANDRSNSILDRRHRFTLALYYDLPAFKNDSNWFKRNLLGNWLVAPIYTYESPEWLDVQSGIDSNLNGDSAGDRTLLNPAGVKGTGSGVTPLCQVVESCKQATDAMGNPIGPMPGPVVAYLAANPKAQYIQAGSGALEPNNGLLVAGRNTLPSKPVDNIDVNVGKNFHFTERFYFTMQAQFFNVLNHPQFTPGFPDSVFPVGYTVSRAVVVASDPAFNNDHLYFPGHARTIQLAAKFTF
jgi:Carboxypeptidase regulatory-like domain